MTVPEKLFNLVTNSALLSHRQEEIVQKDIRVQEIALHGEAMPYYGGDPVAQGYTPAPGPLVQPSGHMRVLRDTPVPDRADMERSLKASRDTLAAGTAPDLSTAAKNALYQQYKEDWPAYQEGMPSHEQMWKPQWQNVQLHMRHHQANKARAKRIQNIHRILEPGDDVFHLEALRPEKPTPYNGAAFRAGYDHIQWSDDQELKMQVAELDDGTYYEFLQLKAAGITARKLFEDKLGISRQQYEACEARLKASAAGLGAVPDKASDTEASPAAVIPARRTAGRPRQVASGKLTPQHPLTAKAQAALEAHGDTVLLIADEGALDENAATAILQQMTPELFPKPLMARNTARMVLRGLVQTGKLRQDGAMFHPRAAP